MSETFEDIFHCHNLKKSNSNRQTKYHKFKMYSAHDSSLNALLVALDYYSNDDNHIWPPFAADLAIELWKKVENENKKYFIKIFYCGEVSNLEKAPNTSKI